jgi:hypothetical protein
MVEFVSEYLNELHVRRRGVEVYIEIIVTSNESNLRKLLNHLQCDKEHRFRGRTNDFEDFADD